MDRRRLVQTIFLSQDEGNTLRYEAHCLRWILMFVAADRRSSSWRWDLLFIEYNLSFRNQRKCIPLECDKSKCKGPLKQYEMMNCQPIYNKPGDCCAVAYNCSEPFGKTSDKCYAKGREYVNFEALRNEDRENPCDNGCICVEGNQGTGVYVQINANKFSDC